MPKDSYVSINDNIKYTLSEYLKVTSFTPSLVKQLKQKKVEIAKSPDNLVTIISWGSWENKVLQSYSSMIQYKNGNHFVVKLLFNAIDSGDSGPRYLQVIKPKNNSKNIYIGIYHVMYSAQALGQGFKGFNFHDDTIDDQVPIVNYKNSMSNIVEINYSYFDYLKIGRHDIYFDNMTNNICVPIVRDNDIITSRYDCYKFNGRFFAKVSKRSLNN